MAAKRLDCLCGEPWRVDRKSVIEQTDEVKNKVSNRVFLSLTGLFFVTVVGTLGFSWQTFEKIGEYHQAQTVQISDLQEKLSERISAVETKVAVVRDRLDHMGQ